MGKSITDLTKDMNHLAEICLNIANLCDRSAEENGIKEYISENLHMGYRALSIYLRRGTEAIIRFQEAYSSAKEKMNLAKFEAESATKFLVDIFGDEDIDSINEADKARIKEFVKKIEEEWELDE